MKDFIVRNKSKIIYFLCVLFALFLLYIKPIIILKSALNFFDSDFRPLGIKKIDNNNIPSSLKDFWIEDNKIDRIKRINDHYKPESNDLYNEDKEKELLEYFEKVIPNNLEKYESVLIPQIKERLSKPKSKMPPSIEETSKYKMPPNPSNFAYTSLNWYLVSKYFQKNNKDEIALLLNQGLFYFAMDFETNYPIYGHFINSSVYFINCLACNNIIKWASKPRPQFKELSKDLARDLLDFVENEYPFSRNVKYYWAYEEEKNRHFLEKGNIFIKKYTSSDIYNKRKELIYTKPIEIADKAYYESKKDFKKLQREIEEFQNLESGWENILTLTFKTVDWVVISLDISNYEKEKNEYELNLAKMEFAAITLAINSYYCENNKLPETMDDLSKWFGKELPVNRLTNEPYTINSKDKHTLFNKGVHESPKETSDDFYFDFSLE